MGRLPGPAQLRPDGRFLAATDHSWRFSGRHTGGRQHVPGRLLHQLQPRRFAQGPARPARHRTVGSEVPSLDRYFCSFAGETYPNRFYQHAAQTDRDHNSEAPSALPTIWDQLSPIPNPAGIPTGGYYYGDIPFLALWASPAIEPGATFKYQAFFHPFADGDSAALSTGTSFIDACAAGTLPNVSFVDPPFDSGGSGTSGDDHPLSDIRLGERFIADAYHALADNGYLDDTVLVITFDEWGGFYDHVPPPMVVDETNPANVMHAGDSTTPTDGQLVPNYRQLGFRVPAIVVSNLVRPGRVVHSARSSTARAWPSSSRPSA